MTVSACSDPANSILVLTSDEQIDAVIGAALKQAVDLKESLARPPASLSASGGKLSISPKRSPAKSESAAVEPKSATPPRASPLSALK